jgi:MSHA biogenesis protein MshI
VLNRMMSTYQNRKTQLRNLFLRKQNTNFPELFCCITISPNEFSLACARNTLGKIELEFCASYPYENINKLKLALTALVKQHQLTKANCSWVLAPQDYQLLLSDDLPVIAEEFQAAIRWKLKDLFHFPVDDIVIDHFIVPAYKSDTKTKIMVVAASASFLRETCETLKTCGLEVSTIDIPELALRNITALSDRDNASSALIYAQEKNVQLFITCQKELYFTRSLDLNLGLSEPASEEFTQSLDRLASEMQRSLDYYYSQWRQTLPTHIFLASTKLVSATVLSHLSQQLLVPVEEFNISEVLLSQEKMSFEQQGKYLVIMGELLRMGYQHHAAD